MKKEDDKQPTTISDEIQTQSSPQSETSETEQPMQKSEAIVVSDEESSTPLPKNTDQSDSHSPSTKVERRQQKRQKEPKKKKRHGARNQHRHKFFVKWLLSKFDLEQSKCAASSPSATATKPSDSINDAAAGGDNIDRNALHETEDCERDHHNSSSCARSSTNSQHQKLHILDVAGGKGEVAARLTMCHQQRVVMVDPRPANIVDCFERIVLPKIPNKWQRRLEGQRENNPDFVRNVVESRFKQIVTTFDDHKIMCDLNQDIDWSSMPSRFGSQAEIEDLQAAVQNATLIVGLHADGATEAIVDAALKFHKPFVVVPCCVFPNFFPMRRLVVDQKDGSPPQSIPVRSHEQFCKFLLQKDPRFVMEELPFEGRNIAIWWDGK